MSNFIVLDNMIYFLSSTCKDHVEVNLTQPDDLSLTHQVKRNNEHFASFNLTRQNFPHYHIHAMQIHIFYFYPFYSLNLGVLHTSSTPRKSWSASSVSPTRWWLVIRPQQPSKLVVAFHPPPPYIVLDKDGEEEAPTMPGPSRRRRRRDQPKPRRGRTAERRCQQQ